MAGWDSLIGQFAPTPTVDEAFIVSGLTDRGMPEHIARGFAMNFKSESNFDPGISELNPTVKGSRGGYGLAQWTGPRRRNLESFAKDSGRRVNDPDMQLDFLMAELQGDEKGAMRHISKTQDAGSAAAAIVNRFLRPRKDLRAKRSAEYLATNKIILSTSNRLWLPPLGD